MSLLSQTFKILNRIRPYKSHRLFTLYQKLFFKKELSVPTFCNIKIDTRYSLNIVPLDVHKYKNCDKVFVIHNNSNENEVEEPLVIVQKGDNIHIKDSSSESQLLNDLSYTIIAPMKANLIVNSELGDIKINNFNGDKILAKSVSGSITVNGFQGREININTENGDVKLEGIVQSSILNVFISDKGSIFINKLLGENACITTKLGNINVNSSYCKTSKFTVGQGDMHLKNIHKHCEVINEKLGNIKMTSFDGQLILFQESGNADINLSRVTENSSINISNGYLLLRLSEECQEKTNFHIESQSINIHENVNVKQIQAFDPNTLLDTEKGSTVRLHCSNCSVDIEAASWFDMNYPQETNN